MNFRQYVSRCVARMSPDEYADAKALDRELKQHWPRWLGWYVLAIGGVALGVVLLKSKIGWWDAFIAANALGGCALAFFLSAWYGYRKWTGAGARRHFASFIGWLVLGAAGVVAIDLVTPGPSIYGDPERIKMLLGVILLMAIAAFAVITAVATLRNREVAQRLALLKGEAERERLERRTVEADLKLLQAQVEPHFLFNTLANVRHLMATGSPQAVTLLDHLISYLRTALPEIRAESTTLGREAELATAYLEIMRMRMGGELRFSFDIGPGLAGHAFPPLILMTLVENAVKHGIVPRGRGEVRVRASMEGDRLAVEVADDGRGFGGALGQGVGLATVRERLKALYGERARLVLESGGAGGALARVEVPA